MSRMGRMGRMGLDIKSERGRVGAWFVQAWLAALLIAVSALAWMILGGDRVAAQTGATTHISSGATLPATCRVGDAYYKTGTSSGLYNCSAANTWTLAGAGTVTNTGTLTSGKLLVGNGGADLKVGTAGGNSLLLGSGASGSGSAYSEIALGTNLSMSGTTLNATGGSGNTINLGTQVLLYDSSASASATLDVVTRNAGGQSGNIFQSDFDEYLLVAENLKPATNATDLYMQASSNNGSSYDTANNYYYSVNYNSLLGTGGFQGNPTAVGASIIFSSIDNTAAQPAVSFDMRISDPLQTTYNKNWRVSNGTARQNAGNVFGFTQQTYWNTNVALTALRFKYSAGNIASGKIRVYGIASSALTSGLGSGWVLLDSKTASASATLDFTTGIDSTYDQYRFEVVNVVPATDGAHFTFQASHDGGATYDTAAGSYFYSGQWTSNTPGTGTFNDLSFSSTYGLISDDLDANTGAAGLLGTIGYLTLTLPSSAGQHKYTTDTVFRKNSNLLYREFNQGWITSASAVNAIRFQMSTGNIASGTIRFYGICKSACVTPGNRTFTSTVASSPSNPQTGDLWLPSNGAWMPRYSGSAWVPWGPIFPFTDPALSAPTTWVNQGGASVDTTNGGVYLSAPATAGDSLRLRVKTAPATPYTITAAFLADVYAVDFPNAGLAFRSSGTSAIAVCAISASATDVKLTVSSTKFTNSTTFSANYASAGFYPSPVAWIRIQDTGVNRTCSTSMDGQHWRTLHTVGRTDFLTADQVGYYVNANNATYDAGMLLLSWQES